MNVSMIGGNITEVVHFSKETAISKGILKVDSDVFKRDASVARDFVEDEPMDRRFTNEVTAQRQSRALGNTHAAVIHLV